MKSLVVVLLVVVVGEARQVCVPGTTFKKSCNTCFCTSDGLSAACTLMGCPSENHFKIYPSAQSTTKQPPKEETKQYCIPNTRFKQSCNTCFCNSEGTDAICTLKGCLEDRPWTIEPAIRLAAEKPSNEDAALKLEKRSKRDTEMRQVCIPNTTWKQDCNTCFCNSDGTGGGCTLMACLPKDFWTTHSATPLVTEKPSNDNGALKLEKRSKRQIGVGQVCKPGTTWKVDCNSCICNSDGTAGACTAVGCLPKDFWTNHSPTPLVTKKPSNEKGASKLSKRLYSTRQSVYGRHCEPGTIVKHYCNTCVCNKFGRVGRCTRMFCDEEMYNEDGIYGISPNGIFKN